MLDLLTPYLNEAAKKPSLVALAEKVRWGWLGTQSQAYPSYELIKEDMRSLQRAIQGMDESPARKNLLDNFNPAYKQVMDADRATEAKANQAYRDVQSRLEQLVYAAQCRLGDLQRMESPEQVYEDSKKLGELSQKILQDLALLSGAVD